MIRWLFGFVVLGGLLAFASCGENVAGGTSEHENVLNSKQDSKSSDSTVHYRVEAGHCRDIGLVVQSHHAGSTLTCKVAV
jgi:hypothetical protein